MSYQQQPENWAWAPKNATHWAPESGVYNACWYRLPTPDEARQFPDITGFCLASRQRDQSEETIGTGAKAQSKRPQDEWIPIPSKSSPTENDWIKD